MFPKSINSAPGWTTFALAVALFSCAITAQTKRPGSSTNEYGEVTVSTDAHHDVSPVLRTIIPVKNPALPKRTILAPLPADKRSGSDAAAAAAGLKPELVNGVTGAATTLSSFNIAGVGNYFNGPDGGFTPATTPSDATGAVGTTEYLQWVDDSFAVFSKATGATLYGPVAGNTLWSGFGGPCETDNDGQPTVNFDKLAQRWVVSQRAVISGPPYYQCLAVSTTSDATGTWNRYSFQISDFNAPWTNLNAKLGVWWDAYYMAFDMYSGSTFEGTKFCALNRAKMLTGQGAGLQCIQLGNEYYSPIISDIDGAMAPPYGTPAYFAADDLSYYALDFFKFHVSWTDSQQTTLSLAILLPEPTYGIACATPCMEQPNQMTLNPHGSHVLGRMPYRNYGTYQSLLAVENAETVTTPIFYETRVASNGDLYMYQEGEFKTNSPSYRFNPSIAEDRAGNIAVAYNSTNLDMFPSQYVVSRAPGDPMNTLGNETLLNPGNGSQTTPEWDSRSSLTVDPNDDCTFYYTEQYQPMDGTDNWSTQIENFQLAGCEVPITVATVPAGLEVSATGSGNSIQQAAPIESQFPVGSTVTLSAPSPQYAGQGSEYIFASWSDGGAQTHALPMPGSQANYVATYNLAYYLDVAVASGGGGTVAPTGAGYRLSGSTVNITAVPAAGYAFVKWTGIVANPSSATTSVTVTQPQTVTAVFAPRPTTVTAALASQSGAASARLWNFTFTNAGPGVANSIEIANFALTQTAGTACKPVLNTKLPLAVGNAAVGAALSASVSVNFSSCPANAVFSLSMENTENAGASSSTLTLTGLSQ
jgi:hypothetical protein